MLFALLCKDKPNALETRQNTRARHLEHLDTMNKDGKLKMAGPFLDADGNANGSLVIVEALDEAEARSIAEADPYAKVGLFENVEIRPFRWTVNSPDA